MRKMAQKMIAIAVAMVIVLGMASVTQMDTLAASYSFEERRMCRHTATERAFTGTTR